MAVVTYSLLRPYKKSDSKDKEKAKLENEALKKQLKERRNAGKSIDSLLVDKPVRIYLHLTIDKHHIVSVKTDEKINPRKWDFKKGKAKSTFSGSPELNKILDDLRAEVEGYYRHLKVSSSDLSFSDVSTEVKGLVAGKKPKQEDNTFFSIYREYIDMRSKLVKRRTLQRYSTLGRTLQQFEENTGYKINFDTIDLKFHDKFVNFLLTAPNPKKGVPGLMNDTVSKYVSSLKHFMKWAFERGYHSNQAYQKSDFGVPRKPKQDIVTINEQELRAFALTDFSKIKRLERVRDLFIFGVFTGQRWSDIEQFRKSDLVDNTWVFESVKTKKKTRVPLVGFSAPAMEILKKYDFSLPKISGQKFNKYIKEAGMKAGLNRPVEIKRMSGNRQVIIEKPLYDFMASHMCRRSCVTILLERGVPPTTIMKLTGHTDLRTLLKYENVGEDALVRALEGVGNINQSKMKVV